MPKFAVFPYMECFLVLEEDAERCGIEEASAGLCRAKMVEGFSASVRRVQMKMDFLNERLHVQAKVSTAER